MNVTSPQSGGSSGHSVSCFSSLPTEGVVFTLLERGFYLSHSLWKDCVIDRMLLHNILFFCYVLLYSFQFWKGNVLFLLGSVAVAGIHVQKWTLSGDVHDCHLGVKWRPCIAVSVFFSSLPLPVPSSWAREKCRWWSAFSDFSESSPSSNSSSSKSLLLGLYSFQGPGIADYRVRKMKCPKWSYRRWLVLVETRKDFMEGGVRAEWYLDMWAWRLRTVGVPSTA